MFLNTQKGLKMRKYDEITANAHKHIMLEIDRLLESKGILIKTGQHNSINEQINKLLLSLVNKDLK
jgi:hypothetical protein